MLELIGVIYMSRALMESQCWSCTGRLVQRTTGLLPPGCITCRAGWEPSLSGRAPGARVQGIRQGSWFSFQQTGAPLIKNCLHSHSKQPKQTAKDLKEQGYLSLIRAHCRSWGTRLPGEWWEGS